MRETYGVAAKIDIIPHGIPNVPLADTSPYKAHRRRGRMVFSPLGCSRQNKGIEHVIEALPASGAPSKHRVYRARRHASAPAWRVKGKLSAELDGGSRIRGGIDVVFFNRFVARDESEGVHRRGGYIRHALPHRAQITSGTLAYVFGAGKAVMSTPYWHAAELLDEGARKARAISRSAGHRRSVVALPRRSSEYRANAPRGL